jgi:hypothetical protein
MTPQPPFPVVLVSGRTGAAGPTGGPPPWRGLGPTARLAALGATLAGAGAVVRIVADPDAHLPEEITAAVGGAMANAAVGGATGDPAHVVVDADTLPHAIVDRLAARYPVLAVSRYATGPYRSADDDAGILAALGLAPTGGWRWVLPVPLLADCGLEVAGADHELAADRVAAVLQAADRADQVGRTVRLVGLDRLDPHQAKTLLTALRPRALRLDLPLAPRHAVTVGPAVAGRRARVILVVHDAGDADALAPALDGLRAAGVAARVEATLTAAADWVDDVADAVVLTGAACHWHPAPGLDWDDVALADATLARATGGPSGRDRRRRARLAAFAALTGGRAPASTDRAGPAVVRSAGGPVEAAGCATVVFAAPGDGAPWGEHVDLVEEPGAWRVDGLTVEALPYRHGRHVDPDGPTVLQLTGAEDLAAFLDDADRARATGAFPRALVHPRTLLADACAWAGPGACPTRRMARAVVGGPDDVRSAPHGIIVGTTNDSHPELARRARHELHRREAERGCAACPVAAVCSRDTCLRSMVSDTDYCAARRGRPWLAAYTDALAARQALAGQTGEADVRVAGFGGWLVAHGDRWSAPDRPPAVLVAGGDRDTVFGFDPRTGRCFRLTADAAAVAECVFGTATADDAAADVAVALGVDRALAADAVARVEALLAARGVAPRAARPTPRQRAMEPVS